MRILALADVESPYLWDYFTPERLHGVDLVISCGDLSPHYLSFLATYSHAPVLYVHGNHDGCYAATPPEGCVCLEDRLYIHQGMRIVGLGGSMRYRPGEHQYTDRQMRRRVRRLLPLLALRGGLDILVTHAPAFGLGDGSDLPHRGFAAFPRLLERWQPACFVHGHMHLNYGGGARREQSYHETRIINAYGHYYFEL